MTLFDLALRLPARTDKAVLFRQRRRGFHFLKEIAFTSANSVSRSCTSRFSISISPVFEMDSTTSCLPILSCWAYLDAIALGNNRGTETELTGDDYSLTSVGALPCP